MDNKQTINNQPSHLPLIRLQCQIPPHPTSIRPRLHLRMLIHRRLLLSDLCLLLFFSLFSLFLHLLVNITITIATTTTTASSSHSRRRQCQCFHQCRIPGRLSQSFHRPRSNLSPRRRLFGVVVVVVIIATANNRGFEMHKGRPAPLRAIQWLQQIIDVGRHHVRGKVGHVDRSIGMLALSSLLMMLVLLLLAIRHHPSSGAPCILVSSRMEQFPLDRGGVTQAR